MQNQSLAQRRTRWFCLFSKGKLLLREEDAAHWFICPSYKKNLGGKKASIALLIQDALCLMSVH